MTDGVTMRIRRKDRLFKTFARMAPEAEKELKLANAESAAEMLQLARSFAPVKTGRLRDSIEVRGPGTPGVPPGSAKVVVGAPHGHLVEFGTAPHAQGGMFAGTTHPGTPRQPFFFPAFRLAKRKHRGKVTRAINRSIKRAKGG